MKKLPHSAEKTKAKPFNNRSPRRKHVLLNFSPKKFRISLSPFINRFSGLNHKFSFKSYSHQSCKLSALKFSKFKSLNFKMCDPCGMPCGPCDPCCMPCGPCGPCIPCGPCDPCPLRKCRSRELRGGILMNKCDCVKRNGLQQDCPRSHCQVRSVVSLFHFQKFSRKILSQGKPCCLTKPIPKCCPAKFTCRYAVKTYGKPSNPPMPSSCTINPCGSGCNPCVVSCSPMPCDPCCPPRFDPCCPPSCDPCCPSSCDPCCPPSCDPCDSYCVGPCGPTAPCLPYYPSC